LAVSSVLTVLSEIGPGNVKHFCSWPSLCPGTKISGGKVLTARTRRSANRVRQALKMAAMSLSRSDSALGAFLGGDNHLVRRVASRRNVTRRVVVVPGSLPLDSPIVEGHGHVDDAP
jgi:Transposase IS116/IS110/IS902 family